MFEIIRVKGDQPEVKLVKAKGSSDAVREVVGDFMAKLCKIIECDNCIEKIEETFRMLERFYPRMYFPTKGGLVFHAPTDKIGLPELVSPGLYDGLQTYQVITIQNSYIRDKNGDLSYTVLITECEPVMPAIYYAPDYDCEPNVIAKITELGSNALSKVTQRYGSDIDVIKAGLSNDGFVTIDAFMEEFVDQTSMYAHPVVAQILSSHFKINEYSHSVGEMISSKSFR